MVTPALLIHPCLAMAGVNFAGAASFLLLYARRRKAAPEYLPYALLCLAIGIYDVHCAGLYGASSLEEGVFWQRLQILTIGAINALLLWFVGLTVSGLGDRRPFDRLLLAFIGAISLFVVAAVLLDGPGITVSPSTPAVKTIHWGGRAVITYYVSAYGGLVNAATPVFYAGYAYGALVLFRAWRETRSRYPLAILLGIAAYNAGLVNDLLIDQGVLNSVYASEYAFLVLVVIMSAALLERFVRLHDEVDALNAALATRVEEAQAEIAELQQLVSICSGCKRIRREDGSWQSFEEYFGERHDTTFSHGMCPACIEKFYPEIAARRAERARLKQLQAVEGSGA